MSQQINKSAAWVWIAGLGLTALLVLVVFLRAQQPTGPVNAQTTPGALPAPAILRLTSAASTEMAVNATPGFTATSGPTATITPTPRPTHPSMDPAGKCSDCHSPAKQTPGVTPQAKP
jgi:hypothetical protein